MFSLASTLKYLQILAFVLAFCANGNALKMKCSNNGTLAGKGNESFCICPIPYTGKLCEDYTCVNGLATGDQYDPSSVFFRKRCLCDAGWTGELCDESLFNRCGQNGKDIKGRCVCEPNFVGDRCDYVTKCTHGQLYNGRCSCHYGWSGDFCDKIICHYGETDETNQLCICPPKYRGKYCDFCAQSASSPPPDCDEIGGRRFISINGGTAQIFTIIGVFVTLIVIGAAIYCFCYRVSRSKSKLQYMRQAKADIESALPANAGETCPLHENNETRQDLTLDSEKFRDVPPPAYETLGVTPVQMEAKIEMLPDSHFFDSYGAAGASSRKSDEIEGDTEIESPLTKFRGDKQIQYSAMVIKQNVRLLDEATEVILNTDGSKGLETTLESVNKEKNEQLQSELPCTAEQETENKERKR